MVRVVICWTGEVTYGPRGHRARVERLEEWAVDILPDALAGDAQAAFTVIDIIEEKTILLGLGSGISDSLDGLFPRQCHSPFAGLETAVLSRPPQAAWGDRADRVRQKP
jgi:hypothetical protein